MATTDEITATTISASSTGGEQIFGSGFVPTFKIVGNMVTDLPPSVTSVSMGSGDFNGRNPDRLKAAFARTGHNLGLDNYDPSATYAAVMKGDSSDPVWTNWALVATEQGTIDSEGTLNHLKHAGSPNLVEHKPSTTANAFVPDTSLGGAVADTQKAFAVISTDTMHIDQLKNKKSFPQQQGGTALSKSQNPASTRESLGSWMTPSYGTWAG